MRAGFRFLAGGTVFVFLLFFTVRSFAFQISERSGEVSITQPASSGQTIETGADARVQFDLESGVIRLGKNSTLHLDENESAVLLKGTSLFDFGKQDRQLLLAHASKQATVRGGTGFARIVEGETDQGNILLVGAVAGKVRVTTDGQSHRLRPGEMLVVGVQGKPVVVSFNLVKLSGSASLLKDFEALLPRHAAIQHEVKSFASLQKRGFIRSGGVADIQQKHVTTATLSAESEFVSLAPQSLPGVSTANHAPSFAASSVTFSSARPSGASSVTMVTGGPGVLTHGPIGTETQIIMMELERQMNRPTTYPPLPPTPITPDRSTIPPPPPPTTVNR